MDFETRQATIDDAEQIADLYLLSRRRFLPYAPVAHSEAEIRSWIENRLIPGGQLTVATVKGEPANVVGMMALNKDKGCGWIDQLYLHPDYTSLGIGSMFVEVAKRNLNAPIRLYTFQQNLDARRFYERHGFVAIEFGDGSGNEEKCPDVLFEWSGQK